MDKIYVVFFFFSSRRRHTRSLRDWSSDVCSSDLSTCLVLSKVLLGHAGGTWAVVARESLTIAGWVAMWRPMQIYLYDWWPVRRRRRIYEKLSHMPVEVEAKGKS